MKFKLNAKKYIEPIFIEQHERKIEFSDYKKAKDFCKELLTTTEISDINIETSLFKYLYDPDVVGEEPIKLTVKGYNPKSKKDKKQFEKILKKYKNSINS